MGLQRRPTINVVRNVDMSYFFLTTDGVIDATDNERKAVDEWYIHNISRTEEGALRPPETYADAFLNYFKEYPANECDDQTNILVWFSPRTTTTTTTTTTKIVFS